MNTTFERSAHATDEWYTPKEIIDALGTFDLDPCAPVNPLWQTADVMYNKNDNGLSKEWFGRVWLNPPYSRPLIEQFVKRLAEHGNGIALLFNRCDSKMFQDIIFEKATARLLPFITIYANPMKVGWKDFAIDIGGYVSLLELI